MPKEIKTTLTLPVIILVLALVAAGTHWYFSNIMFIEERITHARDEVTYQTTNPHFTTGAENWENASSPNVVNFWDNWGFIVSEMNTAGEGFSVYWQTMTVGKTYEAINYVRVDFMYNIFAELPNNSFQIRVWVMRGSDNENIEVFNENFTAKAARWTTDWVKKSFAIDENFINAYDTYTLFLGASITSPDDREKRVCFDDALFVVSTGRMRDTEKLWKQSQEQALMQIKIYLILILAVLAVFIVRVIVSILRGERS